MNISQRLRTCARHTGLDAVIELLNEAADEIDALQARANGQATQPAEVTDERLLEIGREWTKEVGWYEFEVNDFLGCARAILALRPVQVPMTDELFDLICNAIDKADTITMEGDYMLDSDDCIAVVRVMQALLSVHHGITAQAKKETP